MTRLAIRRILAAYDAAVASLRRYAAEPVAPEPVPTVAPWLAARLEHAEQQAETLARIRSTLDAAHAELERQRAMYAAERDAWLIAEGCN